MEENRFEINWNTLWKIFVFIIIVALLYKAREAASVLLVAVVISLGLDPFVDALERKGIHRMLGTLIVFILGIFVIGLLLYFIVPIILGEATLFLASFNKTIGSILGTSLPQATVKNLSLGFDKVLSVFSAANISVSGALGALVSNMVLFLATFISSFYLTAERDGVERLLRVILPQAYERSILAVFTRFKIKIRRWFAAQLGLSIVVGGIVSIALFFMGVRYPLVLGFLAAVFELVPLIGPIITGLVAFLIAVSDSVSLGLWTLLVFFGIQQFENHILTPLVMGRAMKVHPVVVVIALLAGSQVAGFVGILLSVPLAVMAQEIFNYLSERKDGLEAPAG